MKGFPMQERPTPASTSKLVRHHVGQVSQINSFHDMAYGTIRIPSYRALNNFV
jgi:hypothetical protein